MDKTTLRKQLLANATAMLEYAERELNGIVRPFEFKYEIGFIYSHNCDCIKFAYNPITKKARIATCHYSSSLVVTDGKVFQNTSYKDDDDITDSYLTNFCWCDASEVEKALTITTQKWSAIKERIASHKVTENNIFNFQV